MSWSDILIVKLLDDNGAPPNNQKERNPVILMWKVIRFFLFVFLLLWFLFSQDFFYVELKPKTSQIQYEDTMQGERFVLYRIRNGETLEDIALRAEINPHFLASINGIKDRRRVRVGQALLIPSKHGAPAPRQ